MKGSIFLRATAVIFALALGDVFATINIDPFKPSDEVQSNRLTLAGDVAPIDQEIIDTEIKRSGMDEMKACEDKGREKYCKKHKKKCDSEKIAYTCKKTCGLCPMTIGQNNEQYGDRIPAVWVNNDKQECSCEPYKYLCSGVVPLGKGDVVCSFNFWARQYKVEFDIQVTKELPDTDQFGFYNVFHMTIGQNNEQYGDRIPAVWVNKDKFFHISSGVSNEKNYYQDYDYTLNQWYHFEIIQEENSKGEVIYSIVKDGFIVNQVFNTLPQRFEEVILYLSDPFYPSFAPFGELKNLNIVNLG